MTFTSVTPITVRTLGGHYAVIACIEPLDLSECFVGYVATSNGVYEVGWSLEGIACGREESANLAVRKDTRLEALAMAIERYRSLSEKL